MNTLHIYTIFHPVKGMNVLTHSDQEYKRVAYVYAESLEGAFKAAQNDLNPDYAKFNIRSTSVGDVIRSKEGETFMVLGTGFQKVELYERK